MAYNRCRLSLCASNWEPLVIEGQMIGVIKRREVPAETGRFVEVQTVRGWLMGRGFDETVMWHLFQMGAVESEYGCAPELEVQLGRLGPELVEVVLTFTLAREAEGWWPRWGRLIEEMCRTFGLGVLDTDGWRMVSGGEALAVVSRTPEWRWYAEQFGWSRMC